MWSRDETAEDEEGCDPLFLLIRATWPFALVELYPASAAVIAAEKANCPPTFALQHPDSLLELSDLSNDYPRVDETLHAYLFSEFDDSIEDERIAVEAGEAIERYEKSGELVLETKNWVVAHNGRFDYPITHLVYKQVPFGLLVHHQWQTYLAQVPGASPRSERVDLPGGWACRVSWLSAFDQRIERPPDYDEMPFD